MTAQFPDHFIDGGAAYAIAGCKGMTELFDPAEHGLLLAAPSTALRRGFRAVYGLTGGRLTLKRLSARPEFDARFSAPPALNGVKSTIVDGASLPWRYEAVDLPIPLTGGLLIGRGFVEDWYEHMGFAPAWKHREVHELIFAEGRLVRRHDRSATVAGFRAVIAERRASGRPIPGEDVGERIRRAFDLHYSMDENN